MNRPEHVDQTVVSDLARRGPNPQPSPLMTEAGKRAYAEAAAAAQAAELKELRRQQRNRDHYEAAQGLLPGLGLRETDRIRLLELAGSALGHRLHLVRIPAEVRLPSHVNTEFRGRELALIDRDDLEDLPRGAEPGVSLAEHFDGHHALRSRGRNRALERAGVDRMRAPDGAWMVHDDSAAPAWDSIDADERQELIHAELGRVLEVNGFDPKEVRAALRHAKAHADDPDSLATLGLVVETARSPHVDEHGVAPLVRSVRLHRWSASDPYPTATSADGKPDPSKPGLRVYPLTKLLGTVEHVARLRFDTCDESEMRQLAGHYLHGLVPEQNPMSDSVRW